MIRKKVFIGGVNTDDADFLIDTKQFIGGLNIRFASSRLGDFGKIQNIEGTREITATIDNVGAPAVFALPSGSNTTIGSIEDPVSQRVFFFNKNGAGDHGIYVYDLLSGNIYTVLMDEDVTGGLEFDSDIHSIDVYGNLIYWTDGSTWQKRINFEAGIKAYHPTYAGTEEAYDITTPLPYSVTTLIRNQPAYVPVVEKANDVAYTNNFTQDGAFQFQYRFVYRDGEESTLSGTSELINYNIADGVENSVTVTIPYDEEIKQDVARVELVCKYLPDGKAFIIKVWDRDVDSESDEIDDHNSETANLEYTFYNDLVGIALADAYYTKLYDSVPITSETLQIGKNKLFLGNNTDGYDTPTTTSMALAEEIGGAASADGSWWQFTYYTDGSHTTTATSRFIDITNIGSAYSGYYVYTTAATPPYPATVDFLTEVTGLMPGVADVVAYLGITYLELISVVYTGNDSTVTNAPAAESVVGTTVFKSAAAVKAGTVFFDEAGRRCGVVTNDGLKLTTTERTYANPAFTVGVNWTLSNANALVEIPEFAAYYAPVLQKCLRTRFFVQTRVNDLTYIAYDTDGAYVANGTFDETHVGLGINISVLVAYGMGYSYQAGDICKFYDSGGSDIYTLKVKALFGQYLVVDLVDLGALPGSVGGLIEIYSPYFPSTSEPYYEVGQIFPINDAHLSTRTYSTLTGSFKGDVTVLERTLDATDYHVEAMSPNDLQWQNWNTHHGRPNFVTKFGQAEKKVSLYWSNQIIPGTKINGLSTFDALDQTNLPSEMVAIRKLCLVDKIESQGNQMLAIGEKESVSIYLGETQITDNGGATFLSSTTGTIGTINPLKGGYGTINPESVSIWNGKVYWFDALRGCAVSYSSNGLFPVSNYKMFKYFKRMGELVREGGYKVYGGYDGFHDEAIFFMPRTTLIPQNTILEDVELNSYTYNIVIDEVTMPDIIEGRVYKLTLPAYTTATYVNEEIIGDVFVATSNQLLTLSQSFVSGTITVTEIMRSLYEPFDGQGGCHVFNAVNDMWLGVRSFRPQWMSQAGNNLVSFYNGKPYVHDDTDNYNKFYGVEYDSILAGIHNDDGNATKIYRAVSIEGDLFDIMHFRTETPNEQSTDLYLNEFRTDEGIHRAALKRDRLSPNTTGTYDEKLFTGDEIRGEVLKFQGVFSTPSSLKSVKFVNIKFDPSLSHTE